MSQITTARLTLVPPTAADAAFVLELLNDPGWIANIGDRGVRTLEAAADYIRDRFGKTPWFVIRDATGKRIGTVGIIVRDGLDIPDLGYALLERHAGRGYATEAAAAVLAYARETMQLDRIAAITAPENRASQRVLEKIGFRYVDTRSLPGVEGDSAYYETPLPPRSERGEAG